MPVDRLLYVLVLVVLVLALFWLMVFAITVIAYATVEMFEGLMSWGRKEFG